MTTKPAPKPLPKPLQDLPDYPFAARSFDTPQGRMHYIDEGQGDAIVFVHGMPTWSFLWRRFVRELSISHRCIAIDHLGFGRSDKPADADYHPRRHSERLSALLAHLDLRDITLVVHDFGGPIGLGHAIRHPQTVSRLVLFNTWMWSLAEHEGAVAVDRAVSGAFGHVMYRWLNGSARWLIPRVLARGNKLDPAAHRAYVQATRHSSERVGQLALARSLLGATDWYAELWAARDRIARKPAQLIWGTQDPTFGEAELERWTRMLHHAQVQRLEKAGHFPQEEAHAESIAAIQRFLWETRTDPAQPRPDL